MLNELEMEQARRDRDAARQAKYEALKVKYAGHPKCDAMLARREQLLVDSEINRKWVTLRMLMCDQLLETLDCVGTPHEVDSGQCETWAVHATRMVAEFETRVQDLYETL